MGQPCIIPHISLPWANLTSVAQIVMYKNLSQRTKKSLIPTGFKKCCIMIQQRSLPRKWHGIWRGWEGGRKTWRRVGEGTWIITFVHLPYEHYSSVSEISAKPLRHSFNSFCIPIQSIRIGFKQFPLMYTQIMHLKVYIKAMKWKLNSMAVEFKSEGRLTWAWRRDLRWKVTGEVRHTRRSGYVYITT